MSDLMTTALLLSILNLALAALVLFVYVRNHRQLRSPFTLALMVFALFLVAHNGLDVYNQATMMVELTRQAQWLFLGENVLQAGALGMLAWATLR